METIPGIAWVLFSIGALLLVFFIIYAIRNDQRSKLIPCLATGQGTCCQSSSAGSEQEIPTSQNKPKGLEQLEKEAFDSLDEAKKKIFKRVLFEEGNMNIFRGRVNWRYWSTEMAQEIKDIFTPEAAEYFLQRYLFLARKGSPEKNIFEVYEILSLIIRQFYLSPNIKRPFTDQEKKMLIEICQREPFFVRGDEKEVYYNYIPLLYILSLTINDIGYPDNLLRQKINIGIRFHHVQKESLLLAEKISRSSEQKSKIADIILQALKNSFDDPEVDKDLLSRLLDFKPSKEAVYSFYRVITEYEKHFRMDEIKMHRAPLLKILEKYLGI